MADKSVINWYPGHMAKAKRLMKEELKNIDLVYEMIDARIPYSSKIKDIDELIKNKIRILIMTKKDLCNIDMTNKWVKYYEDLGYNVLLVDLKNTKDYEKVVKLSNSLTRNLQEKRVSLGLNKKEIKAIVIGIPNVGKSTLINRMTGKNITPTANKPGVTKTLTYLKTKENILILDTPGILWPKLDDEITSFNIAITGGIKKEILDINEICLYLLKLLSKYYPQVLKEVYGISGDDIMEMYNTIAKRLGAFKNKEIDYDKVSERVYNDIVGGRIRGVTLDIYGSRFTKI